MSLPVSAVDTLSSVCEEVFAVTECQAWNRATSAARLSAEHAEEAVAASGPVARFVDTLLSLGLNTCLTIRVEPLDDTVSA